MLFIFAVLVNLCDVFLFVVIILHLNALHDGLYFWFLF